MNAASRWGIGILTLLAVALLVGIAHIPGEEKHYWPRVSLAAFFGAGGAACIWPRSRPVTVRLIGGCVFAATAWYLWAMASDPPSSSGSRSEPSLPGAVGFFVGFGLPAGAVVILGRFPHLATGRIRRRTTDFEEEPDNRH